MYSSGCSSYSKKVDFCFNPISWAECDTLGKKIGFVAGAIISSLANAVHSIWNFGTKVVQIFSIDKLVSKCFEVVGRTLSYIANQISNIVEFTINNLIQPFFTSKLTKSVATFTYDKILTPIGQVINKVARFIFVSVLWNSVCVPIHKYILVPIYNKFPTREIKVVVESKETTKSFTLPPVIGTTLETLANWTIVPIARGIGDAFEGIVGGIYGRNKEEVRKEVMVEDSLSEDEIELPKNPNQVN